jgi:2-succinyl-5-enolpyruvyl-6-hydroxy-3-cyclohexene-1-carboxylate synthase
MLHDVGGLAALRDVSAPVRVVVVDNDGGGIFGFLPQADTLPEGEFEALLGTPRGVDTAKAADLFSLAHQRLDSLDELPGALAGGTRVIEVCIKREANVALHRELAAGISAAVVGLG